MATVGRDIGDIGDVLSRRERAGFRPYRGHFCRFIADGLRCPWMTLAPPARSCRIKRARRECPGLRGSRLRASGLRGIELRASGLRR